MITKKTTLKDAKAEIASRMESRIAGLAEEPEFAYELWLVLGQRMSQMNFRQLTVHGDAPECNGTIDCECDGEQRRDCLNYDEDDDERYLGCPWCSITVDRLDFAQVEYSAESSTDEDATFDFGEEEIEMEIRRDYDYDLLTYKHTACGMPVRLQAGWTVD